MQEKTTFSSEWLLCAGGGGAGGPRAGGIHAKQRRGRGGLSTEQHVRREPHIFPMGSSRDLPRMTVREWRPICIIRAARQDGGAFPRRQCWTPGSKKAFVPVSVRDFASSPACLIKQEIIPAQPTQLIPADHESSLLCLPRNIGVKSDRGDSSPPPPRDL